jgi:transcriptional regulator with XRE-family HTH domain
VIPIENEGKRVDWHKIRAEYITGVSQRQLAEKYGVSRTMIERRSRNEKWSSERVAARAKVQEKVIQKTAQKAADNASIAADIKRKALLLLDRLVDDFAQHTATEHREYNEHNLTDIKRLRDLTAAYKDLTADMATGTGNNELLQSLYDMERRAGL